MQSNEICETASMKSFEEYQHKYAYVTVSIAAKLIRDLDCCGEKVLVPDSKGKIEAVRIDDFCDSLIQGMACYRVKPVIFSGGPPDKYFWITGRLVDYIVDKMMYRDAVEERRGMSFAHVSCMSRLPVITNLGY